MAQLYIYNSDYVDQVYREIGILHEQFSKKGVSPINEVVVHSSTNYRDPSLKAVILENARFASLNLITGFGVVILTLLIIYLLSRIIFWLTIISLCIVCFSFFAKGLLSIDAGEKRLQV